MRKTLKAIAVAAVAALPASAANALTFDQNITPTVIFGSGNANGGFTVDRNNGVELGLRAKLRFDENNQPQNQFNSNGDGSYTFAAGTPPTGFGFAANSPTTPIWNFEWSVNTNFDGTGLFLRQYQYLLELDADPGAGTNFLSFDPITPTILNPFADHAIGTNATGNGAGVKATDAAAYVNLLAANNVAQNSWNYEFFNDLGGVLDGFDPNDTGTYTIRLSAFNDSGLAARTEINVIVSAVPLPAAFPLLAAALGLFGVMGWRRRRAA